MVYSPLWASKLLDVKMGRVHWILSGLRVPIANSSRKCVVFGVESFLQLPLRFLAKLGQFSDLLVFSPGWSPVGCSGKCCPIPRQAVSYDGFKVGFISPPAARAHGLKPLFLCYLFVMVTLWAGAVAWADGAPLPSACYTSEDWSIWFYEVMRFSPV